MSSQRLSWATDESNSLTSQSVCLRYRWRLQPTKGKKSNTENKAARKIWILYNFLISKFIVFFCGLIFVMIFSLHPLVDCLNKLFFEKRCKLQQSIRNTKIFCSNVLWHFWQKMLSKNESNMGKLFRYLKNNIAGKLAKL